MKKLTAFCLTFLAAVGVAWAAQDENFSIRDVRNPVVLRDKLESNASDAQSRIAALEAAGVGGTLESGQIIVGNAGNAATNVVMSGDATISNAGAVSIAAGLVYKNVAITTSKAGTTNTVTFTAKDSGNATVTGHRKFTYWLSADALYGTPSATNVTSATKATGIQLGQSATLVTDMVTATNGTASVVVIATATNALYIHASAGNGVITALPLVNTP